jgi:PAS domain S-box-containing protein
MEIPMTQSFAALWLSRVALVAAVVFAYCAWKILTMDRRAAANRIAFAFNIVFMLWATAASFWYGTPDAGEALHLYRAFSWTWCVFPALILHFTLSVAECKILTGSWRLPFLVVLYLPAILLAVVLPYGLLDGPVFRGGYWMLAVHHNAIYYLFVIHYLVYILVSILLAFHVRANTGNRRARKRMALLGSSYIAGGLLGFITDTLFLYLGIDFPNMAIIWIVILSIGLLVAMHRYGFLSIMPASEALAALESMAGFVIYLDDTSRVIWANASALKALGATSIEQARKQVCSDFLPPEAARLIRTSPDPLGDQRGTRASLGPDNIPVSLRFHPVSGDGTGGFVLTAIDLRPEYARAHSERRLADAGLMLDEFISRSLDGIVIIDAEGYVARWNSPMVSITGIPSEDAVGTLYWNLQASMEPENRRDIERIRRAVQEVMDGLLTDMTRRIVEMEIVRRDGARRIVQSDAFSIPMAEGTGMAMIVRDMTDERRRAEENIDRIRKLDHAQKMEAVGTLSGGIAHDFNNTLAGIIGAVSLIKQEIESGSHRELKDMGKELDIIERSANRAASSVRRLLTLTRKRSPETARFRLDEAMAQVAAFASRSVDQSVEIRLAHTLPEATMIGDPGQIEQMLLNLIINAEHAMTIMRPRGQKRGGRVTLDLELFHPDKDFLAANLGASNEDYWRISVTDEGVGIPRHILNKIFDPFFTTKPDESSSGLGLAMVHAIAHQHAGFVDVQSEPGAGTELTVYLPATAGKSEPDESGASRVRKQGLVLVADDDDIPRETAIAIVEALGYTAVPASSGVEALELFTDRPDEWVAVILDRRMGEPGGAETAEAMRTIRPGLPVVLASGFHDFGTGKKMAQQDHLVELDKPYTISELESAMERAVARPVSGSGSVPEGLVHK